MYLFIVDTQTRGACGADATEATLATAPQGECMAIARSRGALTEVPTASDHNYKSKCACDVLRLRATYKSSEHC